MFESASDRSVFLKDFGVDVKYTIQNGVPKKIRGIFDNQFIDVETGGDVGFAIQQPRLMVRTADVASCTEGDAFQIAKVNYLSRIVQDDGTGMTMIVLEKQ